ncbi:unnamed protein product, partial [Pylaiella littoralis]
ASAPVATRATTLRYGGVGVPPGAVRRSTTAAAAKAAKGASAKARGAVVAEENASPTSMVEEAGIYSHVATAANDWYDKHLPTAIKAGMKAAWQLDASDCLSSS